MMQNEEDLPALLNKAANCLLKARREEKEDLTVELTMNFIWLKKFVELMGEDTTTVTSSVIVDRAEKFSFIISNIYRNIHLIPAEYKKKVQDHNACSIFYDLENLYEFNKNKPFPKEFDAALSRELTMLLSELIDFYTVDQGGGRLALKRLDSLHKKVIKFDRDSIYFQYFSYYKDQEHLSKAIELIDFTDHLDISAVSGRYQFLSAMTQIIEHISKRMLSPRMTNYLSSDINADDLAMARNFIVHREKDKVSKLEEIVMSLDGRILNIRQELSAIKLSLTEALDHLKLAVKPRVMVGDVFQRADIFLKNTADENIESISKFYEKTDSGYKYAKIPHNVLLGCKNIGDFESLYPNLSSKITLSNKEAIISTSSLGNRKLFIKLINEIANGLIRHRLYNNEVKAEITSLKKDVRVEITTLQQLDFSEDQPGLSEFDKIVFATKKIQAYKNKLKAVISKLKSSSDEIEGSALYSLGIDFDAYRVSDIPRYRLTDIVSDLYAEASIKARPFAPKKYIKEESYYKIKHLYGDDSLEHIKENEIGIGIDPFGKVIYQTWGGRDYLRRGDISIPYEKLVEMIFFNNHRITHNAHFIPPIILKEDEEKEIINFVVKQTNLQFILIPLTHQEHAYIYKENLQPYEAPFIRYRVIDENTVQRIKRVFTQTDMQERIKNYLAFLEISEQFLSERELLLEAELYLVFIDHYNRLIDESHLLSTEEVARLRGFRNYLSHDRDLGEAAKSHSHEQITLRFLIEFTRKIEDSVIPALHHIITSGNILGREENNIIVLNLHDINMEHDDKKSYDDDQNMLLVKLLQDSEIAEQIIEFIHSEGLKKVKEFFFRKNDAPCSKYLDDLIGSKDSYNLEAGNRGFFNLFGDSIDYLSEKLGAILDMGIDGSIVEATILQLQALLIMAGSGGLPIGIPHRYKHDDDDFEPNSGGGSGLEFFAYPQLNPSVYEVIILGNNTIVITENEPL